MKKWCFSLLVALTLFGCKPFTNENAFIPENLFTSNVSSDTTIATAVNEALMNDDDFSNLPITVESRDGVVFLSGYVKTIRQSDAIGGYVAKVNGVKEVQNNIIVRK